MSWRDIFISYSSKDEAIAQLACERLEQTGHCCWFAPRDIPPGEFYAGQIIQALRESRLVLLFFSEHSNGSAQVVREINFAVSQRLPMLVVRLDPTPLNNDFEYLIRINQWLDVSHLPNDPGRVAEIPPRIEAAFAKLKTAPKGAASKAPVAMVFGDFEILADSSGKPIELGRGGMGVTYRARQISLGGRAVALKVIQPDLLGDDNVRRRFLREAKLASEIDHENVALVLSRGQEGDSYFYAMQLVDGVDLDRYVKANGPLSVRDALSVTAQMASALEAANSKGLIHRDIKPSNLMASRRRSTLRVKLIDFGLAKDVGQRDIQSSILSGKDEFKGTLAFASPEQCRAQELDTRSDLYSLGVTLWFLLSGKVPFRGSIAEVSGSHLFAPLPLAELPTLPEAIVQLLQSLLAKNPADRPQTPAELEDRIQALLAALPPDPEHSVAHASRDLMPKTESVSTLVGAPGLISYLEPAVGQLHEERFELLEALVEGASGRLFRARERRGVDSRLVALKFLHPSIYAEEDAAESLKNQFAALQKLSLEHLLKYFTLELGAQPPFLVREWVHGLSLQGVLRLKNGTLSAPEVSALLEPLPELLDSLASSGLSLITVRLSKLWVRLPGDLDSAGFEEWVKQAPVQTWANRLALDPLSLRSLVTRSFQAESDVTLLPTSRSLALQQNRAGIQGRTPAQLLATVLYELLGGRPPQTEAYRPLTALPEAANRRLKEVLAPEGVDHPSAGRLWIDLKRELSVGSSPFQPTQPQPVPDNRSAAPTPKSVSIRPPAPEPSTFQTPQPTPPPVGPRKITTRTWLVLSALGLLTFILLGVWLASHHNTSLPAPTPTATPKLSVYPSATPVLTPSATLTASNDELARAAFVRGDAARDKSDYQTAIADYSEVIQLKPDNADAFARRGFVYNELKQHDEAIADYSEAIRLKPDYADAFYKRGNAYLWLRQYEKAIADYSKAIRLRPDYADAFNGRGHTYLWLRQYEKTIADFSEVIRLKPDDTVAFSNRGFAYCDLQQYDKAIADFSEAIRLKPDDSSAYENRAETYEKSGNTEAAARDRAKVKELTKYGTTSTPTPTPGPTSSPFATPTPANSSTPTNSPSNESLASAAFYRGDAAEEKGDYQQAITKYTEAIRLKPDYHDAFYNRGIAYENLSQYQKAINDYTDAIRLKPHDPNGYTRRADCYKELGNTVAAKRDRDEATVLTFTIGDDDQQATSAFNLGLTVANKGDYQHAIIEFSDAIRLKPDYAVAFYNRAKAYDNLKEYQTALSDYTEYIRLVPNDPDGYSSRADCYEKLGNNTAAQRDRAKAKQLTK